MTKYMFIDESGDLGENGSKFLVISALICDNPKKLDKIIKNMRRNKFKKALKGAMEIKANKSSSDLIKWGLKRINEVKGIVLCHIVLEKRKNYSKFLKKDKHKLYNYVSGKLAKCICLDCDKLEIKIDDSKGKQFLQEDFNHYFKIKLVDGCSIGEISILHARSENWSGIQLADIVAWACFQKFEHNNSSFIDLLEIDQDVNHVW